MKHIAEVIIYEKEDFVLTGKKKTDQIQFFLKQQQNQEPLTKKKRFGK